MQIEQIYTNCLAQGAYYVESEGEAVIIDPLREVDVYIERAKNDNATIKYILETHFHADFISGHVTLAEKTKAKIVFGPHAKTSFPTYIAQDNEELKVGKITLRVLHTPGHTLESTCYLLIDENGRDHAIFTGDTLFLGDVGRPDLSQGVDMKKEDLAGILYDSLRNKIMPLGDDVIVYPAHGAGSACGKNMMQETVDTLGNQKKVNYALQENMTKAEFVQEVIQGLLPPPTYFDVNVKMNKEGYTSVEKVMEKVLQPLEPNQFEALAKQRRALILDVRSMNNFCLSHIPNSIFIGLDGSFAPWVGELVVDTKVPILLITPEGREKETIIRLSRVGFDNTLGYLKGGIAHWQRIGKPIASIESITAQDFSQQNQQKPTNLLDVREKTEYNSQHVKGAMNIPLRTLHQKVSEIPKQVPFYVHCLAGYRSVIAISILKSRGIHNLVNIEGGFKAMKETSLELSH